MKRQTKRRAKQIMLFMLFMVIYQSYGQDQIKVTGKVTNSKDGNPISFSSVLVKGNEKNGTMADFEGKFEILAPSKATLLISSIGFVSKEIPLNGKTTVNVSLDENVSLLNEIVVVGYASQKKKSITGAISNLTSDDIDKVHGGSTVSSALAGKIPGVSFKMADGRPGASASIQIRNMGTPLYVIDGIQQDEGQFNNLSSNDIETLTILKDGSAAVYGMKAANGVIVVTTKRGRKGTKNTVNINSYIGWQNWSRFPNPVNDSYQWMLAKADADINQYGTTNITAEELEKYKIGKEKGYQSFNWKDFIVKKDAPLSNINVSATGGSETINYYISATKLKQEAVLGDEFTFERSNIQSNIDANISERLKVGVQVNGRIETRNNPGIPGADDYWLPRFAILKNRPFERPYANDNPEYLNDIGHNETNWALHNFKTGGYSKTQWRVMQYNFNGDYSFGGFLNGLKLGGKYSYYIADQVMNGHEYTYKAYTYDKNNDTYNVTGGSTNPWRERRTSKIIRNIYQGSLNYKKKIENHTIEGLFLVERQELHNQEQWVHAVPKTNSLPLLYFPTIDTYNDIDNEEARIGYVGRLNYNFKDKYLLEAAVRRDASWKFAPNKKVGVFPSYSAGWRVTEEGFLKNLLGEKTILDELKIRASYGVLGDDNIGIGSYDYLSGYNYNVSGGRPVILDGTPIVPSRDKGQIVNNLSWFESRITDIGADFFLFKNKLSGTFDYFKRQRTGLRGRKYDILIPNELGYSLPEENVNSDQVSGYEGSLAYNGQIGGLKFNVSGNTSFTRTKFIESYKPRFDGSYQEYRSSSENRYNSIYWGYTAIGQFQSQNEIDNYNINNDGRGNQTMLPGDIKYKDVNGDGRIDWLDETPIGYNNRQPLINFGFSLSLSYKGFDFTTDFSGASGYSWIQNWETKVPFQGDGALNEIFLDRWHRANPLDANSEWIPGKYPALRYNAGGHNNYNKNSTFWMHNVTYVRARTIEIGYSLPKNVLEKIGFSKARFYVNGYNLFSIDNLKSFGVDPEVNDDNGLQYPQNKFVNVGVNLSL